MKVIIVMCFILFYYTLELMFPLYLIFHVKVYSLFPLTSKVCTRIFIYKLIPYQQGCVLSF
jgi:hypothetical protein